MKEEQINSLSLDDFRLFFLLDRVTQIRDLIDAIEELEPNSYEVSLKITYIDREIELHLYKKGGKE